MEKLLVNKELKSPQLSIYSYHIPLIGLAPEYFTVPNARRCYSSMNGGNSCENVKEDPCVEYLIRY